MQCRLPLPLHKFHRRRGQIALRKCITITATIINIITMVIITMVAAGIMVTGVIIEHYKRCKIGGPASFFGVARSGEIDDQNGQRCATGVCRAGNLIA
jgi:hypothetical protein